MIKSATLWHITPVDLGIEFFDQTNTMMLSDEKLFSVVNDIVNTPQKGEYSKHDYVCIEKMRTFVSKMHERIKERPECYQILQYPGIPGCFALFRVNERMVCYIMASGIAVFEERGEPIPFDDEEYFSIPVFYERQIYEDDYCYNPEETERKRPLYEFTRIMWGCIERIEFSYSASEDFRNHGVSYTLCITMLDIPELLSNHVDLKLKRNIRAMLDTSAFSNILNLDQWELIRRRIDQDDISDLSLRAVSENLVFADSWAGVLLAGDLKKNDICIRWLIEFEVWLQSQWFLFDAYCENISRMQMSVMELQGIINRIEYSKGKLDNDISSNMPQSCHMLRNSLIKSSEVNTIYMQLHSMAENKLRMKQMSNEQRRLRFAILSDISLLLIALLEVYDVVKELLAQDTLGHDDAVTIGILGLVGVLLVWIMIKGKL